MSTPKKPSNGNGKELLTLSVDRIDDSCPFLNESVSFELSAGDIVWLRGASGSGKTTICMQIAGLSQIPGAKFEAVWDPSVPVSQRVGFLFQKGVLIDSLNLAENLALALRAGGEPYPPSAIRDALTAVGLSDEADGSKMPGQLSGGMLRRAALAQILAQRKRLVILDEPFVGLDPPVALEVVKLIKAVAVRNQVAMVLVSHMEPLASMLQPTRQLHLERARPEDFGTEGRATDLSRLPFAARCGRRLLDYLFYSLPLIVCAFGATGAAVAMLLADMLRRVDVVAIVSGFLQKYLQGNPALPMILGLVDRIVKANEAEAKKKLYALAIGSVFTIELGPLLTALLLAGRIGGAYAGEVAMMAATSQLDLLRILGVPASSWTFLPAMLAALVAAPILTAIGTAVALAVGAFVGGPHGFDIVSYDEYWREIGESVLERREGSHVLKHAPLVNAYRSIGFMASTMIIAQLCARWRRRAQPRHVPIIITSAVVLSCLAVLLLDWGFSQAYVRLDDSHLAAAAAASDASALYSDRTNSGADDGDIAGSAHAAAASGGAGLDDATMPGVEAEAERVEYENFYKYASDAAVGAAVEPSEEELGAAFAYGEGEDDVDGDRDEL